MDGKIKHFESELTIAIGKVVVYGARRFQALAPQLPAISPRWSAARYYCSYQIK